LEAKPSGGSAQSGVWLYRDHRPDCRQLVLALVVIEEGFPLSYEVFEGNCAKVTTLEEILGSVERKHAALGRVWVFDRGIVSEENLALLRRRGAFYLVATPQHKLAAFEQELLKADCVRGGTVHADAQP
jgi:transposase